MKSEERGAKERRKERGKDKERREKGGRDFGSEEQETD